MAESETIAPLPAPHASWLRSIRGTAENRLSGLRHMREQTLELIRLIEPYDPQVGTGIDTVRIEP